VPSLRKNFYSRQSDPTITRRQSCNASKGAAQLADFAHASMIAYGDKRADEPMIWFELSAPSHWTSNMVNSFALVRTCQTEAYFTVLVSQSSSSA
jgi:hypothetical protein